MSDSWRYRNPVEVITPSRGLQELPDHLDGCNILLVTTPGFKRRGLVKKIKDIIGERLGATFCGVEPNPSLEGLEKVCEEFRGQDIDSLLALGGGSVLDTGKALSLLLKTRPEEFDLAAHLRGEAELPELEPLELIAVPTTHGTGSEVTPFATIWSRQEKKKYSLAAERLYPRCAFLDPQLTLTLPAKISTATGLDALSQGLEALWNNNASPLSDLFAAEAVRLAFDNLRVVVEEPENLEARSRMQRAALCSGLAISQPRTALSHSLSYPLTARFGIPHGLACGITLPAIWDFVREAHSDRAREIAGRVGFFKPDDVKEGLITLFEALDVKQLLSCHLDDFKKLLEPLGEMYTPERAGNSIRPVDREDIERIMSTTVELFSGDSS